MSEERRERQDLNLFSSTLDTRSDVSKGQTAKQAHRARFPNRWERIGSRVRDPESVFENLIPHINEESLREAFKALDETKALGLDGISQAAYGENLEKNLTELVHRIKDGSYKPQSKKDAICLRFISEQIGFFSHNKIFLQVG